MKIIWNTHYLPELRNLSRKRRSVLTGAAGNNWLHNLHFTLHFGAGLAFLAASFLSAQHGLKFALLALVLLLSYYPIAALLVRPTLRRLLLNRHGIPFVCFECGYRFFGVRYDTCPGCASPVPIKNYTRS